MKNLILLLLISSFLSGCEYFDYLSKFFPMEGTTTDTTIVVVPDEIPNDTAECFIDLTPDDGFNSENSFNAPKFRMHLKNLKPTTLAKTFNIPQPDFLTNKSLFVATTGWISTCSFAFEDQDFSRVLNSITSAANGYGNKQTSWHSKSLAWNSNVTGYNSKDGYWLVPIFLDNGKIWLKIDRKVDEPGKYGSYYYSATGYWMLGRGKDIEGDVS